METGKDKKTGLQVTAPIVEPYQQLTAQINNHGLSSLSDYNLIRWCEQYLSSDNSFIDIGCGIGLFSLILSRKCKEVWAFDSSESLISCLAISSSNNNCYNIRPKNIAVDSGKHSLDSFNITNVGFISIDVEGLEGLEGNGANGSSEFNILLGSILTLVNSSFPPIMIKLNNDESYKEQKELVFTQLRKYGYTIHPIGGCINRYLASDHAQHKTVQQIRESKEQEKRELHMKQTILQYEKQETSEFTWFEWYLMSRHYRLKSEHQLSYDCAHHALTFKVPEEKKYLPWEELSIVTCYLNKKEEGYQAAENVIIAEHAPFSSINLAMKNQSFYMQALPLINVITLSPSMDSNYVSSSSAIIIKDDGYLINVRAVNYELTKDGSYITKDPGNIIRTRNYLLSVDSDFKTISATELLDNTGVRKYLGRVHGIEDLRMFAPGEFFCTCLQVNDKNIPQMCYGRFKEDGTISKLLPLQVGNKLQCEKNWLPFYIKDELHMIYTVSPLRLYSVDVDTGVLTLIKEIDLTPNKNIDFFRGSATLIEYRCGWLGTIHQVHHDSRRMYFHRFIWFNSKFTELKYSKAFFFESPNVEFNLSICHSSKGLLVPYSVNDACSKVGILPYEVLDTLV